MIAYVDSSVVLRLVLRQAGPLPQWRDITRGVASAILEVECLRTLDRLHRRGDLSDKALGVRRDTVYQLIDAFEVVDLSAAVLRRASMPFPTPLGTLDAIHLATALLWRDERESELVMATHDAALAEAARACGMSAIGSKQG